MSISPISTLLAAAAISLAQLLLFGVCGLGLARLLTTERLRAHEVTLAPLFGLALLALLGFYGANAGLTMRQILPIALALAGVLLAVALLRRHADRAWPGRPPRPELLPLLLLMLCAWLVSVAPLLGYGALLPIGHNWDVEFYLPLAAYLKDYSYATLALAPANPLRDLLLTERIAARAMGATYAQAMADLLGRWDAWDSWVPMLALLRALTLPGLYALLRGVLGVRAPAALAGCALAAINSLLLWTTYNSFGMGIGGLALLPAALACTALALDRSDRRPMLAAMLLLGGLTCTYWPMLQPYGAAALGLGLALLWERRRGGWAGVIGRGALVLAGGGLLGLLAHLRAPAAFIGVIEARTASMGITEFISPAVVAGSAPFSHLGLAPSGALETALAWAGLAAALLLLARGAWRGGTRRGLAIGLALGSLAYLLGLRFVVRFPYGYLRGASYINTLLLGIAGAGLLPWPTTDHRPPTAGKERGRQGEGETRRGGDKEIHQDAVTQSSVLSSQSWVPTNDHRPPTTGEPDRAVTHSPTHPLTRSPSPDVSVPPRHHVTLSRLWPVLLAIVLVTSSALASYRTYDVYAERPAVFDLETADMRAAVAGLARPGPVYLSSAPELRGPYLGAWAYALRGHELLGIVQTGFSALVNTRPGVAPAYGMVARGEDPREHGLDPAARVWQGERSGLYEAPAGQLAWLSGRPTAYTEGELTSVDTTYSRAQIGVGSYLEALPERPLALYASGEALDLEPLGGAPQRRELRLALASFTAQTVEVELGAERRRVSLPAGNSIYRTGALTTPLRVTLRGESAPLVLRWAALDDGGAPAAAGRLDPVADTLMIGLSSEARQGGARTRLTLQNATGEMTRLAIEIYQDVPGYEARPTHYAWALFPAPGEGVHEIAIGLEQPAMALDGAPLPAQTGELRDGRYFAALWVYQGEQARRTLPFLRFERRDGKVATVTPLDLNAAFVRLAPPEDSLAVQFDEGIGLDGFELSAGRLRPGDRLRVSLLWRAEQPQAQPYLVFAQLLDDTDRKIAQWDGAAGGDWWPTPAWRPGQRVWQDVPLQITADAPPGSYRLIAGLYDPATGARLRLHDGGDTLLLGRVEVRR